jgi:dihydrofolate synthase/folylpolyglutamate synthase
MKNYDDTIQYLYSLQNFGIKLGLKNISALLEKLSSPHEKLKTVHIAGTNGKGSTAAMLESILIEAGYKVGLYTSPHLVDFKERFRINGVNIDKESVVRLTRLIREKKDELGIDMEITFFEYTTALAFCYFMQEEVDIAIIEVGMGGRLDATNVLTPMVSVITSISIEHGQYLGDTIEEIAGEKAGIIKDGVPVVSGVHDVLARAVIKDLARKKGAKFYQLGMDFNYHNADGDTFDYIGMESSYEGLNKRLKGRHQFDNSSVCLACLDIISEHGFKADEEAVKSGLGSVRWEGRFEKVSERPVMILDGAHNNESMESAVSTLKETYPGKKVISVVGVMGDKDVKGVLRCVSDVSQTVILTRPEINRAADPDELAAYFDGSRDVVTMPVLCDAISHAKSICDDDSLIFVTGSLFTVGDAKKCISGC